MHRRRAAGLLTFGMVFSALSGVTWAQTHGQESAQTKPATLHLRTPDEVPLIKAVPGAREVVDALDALDWQKAKALVTEIQKKSPNDPLVLVLVVRVYRWNSSLALVRKEMARALELAPDDPRVLYESVMVRLWDDGLNPAQQQGQEALKAHPNSACLLKLVGDFHNAKDEYSQAIAALEGPAKGLREPDGRAGVYQTLAEAYLGDNKQDLALKAIDETLRLGPGDPAALDIRAQILESMGDLESAYETYRSVKRNPGKFVYDKGFLRRLDRRMGELKPKVMAIKEKRMRQDREKVIALGEVYQSNPTDVKARDGFAAYMMELCEVIGVDSTDALILVEEKELSENPTEKAPEKVMQARKAALKMIDGDPSINARYNARRDHAQLLLDLEKAVSIYPSSQALYMMAMIHFQEKSFNQAAYFASLASGISSLERYQRPKKEEEDAFAVIENPYVWSRRLALEAIRFRDAATTPDDVLLQNYLTALNEEDWVRLQESYREANKSKTWASSKNPVAWSSQISHARYNDQIQKTLVAKGRQYLREDNKQEVKRILGLLAEDWFDSPDALKFAVMGWKFVGDAGQYKKALDKALALNPYDPEIRFSLGMDAEKAGKLEEAMFQYNAGAKGLDKKALPVMRQANAVSRDGIESKVGAKYEDKYAAFIDGERKAQVIAKERRAVISAAVSRLIGNNPKSGVLYMIRCEEAYRMGDYQGCMADAQMAMSLKPELKHQAQILIGDANYQLSRGKNLTDQEYEEYLGKAISGYTKALESAPSGGNLASLYFARGMRYMELKQPDEAIKDLTKAGEQFDAKVKNKAWAYFHLSRLWEAKGNNTNAKACATKAWELAKELWPGAAGVPKEIENRFKRLSGQSEDAE
jgi:tetratricopeptide (TPR) repeat protein